ncbi:MAG: Calx-beta domain-containing protein [Planctomycetaceae bacterium]
MIAYNGRSGVDVGNGQAVGVSVLRNSIHSNFLLGIDLAPLGVTDNDVNDADSGANNLTNFPVITSAARQGNQLLISGTLDAEAGSSYRIQVFGSAERDPSGSGEGQIYLGDFTGLTDAAGHLVFHQTITPPAALFSYLSVTATDAGGSTSEFSAAFPVPFATFRVDAVTAGEGDGVLNLTVSLDRAIDIPVDVVVQLTEQSATATIDFDAAPLRVHFPANSTASQIAAVPIVDDHLTEDSETFRVSLSTDSPVGDRLIRFVSAVTATIVDNDSPSFSVTETNGGTRVSEDGSLDTINVVLNTQPQSAVTLSVVGSDFSELTVSPMSLVFTPENWDVPQSVSVQGIDDTDIDGSQTAGVTVAVDPAHSDPRFGPLGSKTTTVTVDDNDVGDVLVMQTAGATVVSEAGGTDAFTLVLNARPQNPVTLEVISDPTQVTVSHTVLTFTPDVWNMPQSIIVTGVDDVDIQGNETSPVIVRVRPELSDPAFSGVPQKTVNVSILDDDLGDLTITESGGATFVSESGTTDSFDVVLNARPVNNVVLLIESTEPGRATVDRSTMVFTHANWNLPQTVTVTGIDDAVVNGNLPAAVTLRVDDAASDDAFDKLKDQRVQVAVLDDDRPGFALTESNGGSEVSEFGVTDSFVVVLSSPPLTDVVLVVESSDLSEVRASPSTIRFTPANWRIGQLVTLTGVDDLLADGDQMTDVTVRVDSAVSDDQFDSLPLQTIRAATLDDDPAGFSVLSPTGAAQVTESGTTTQLSVTLNAQPAIDVVLRVSSLDATEAAVDQLTRTLTFPPDNWYTAQTVNVFGLEDFVVDGTQKANIRFAVDPLSDGAFSVLEDQLIPVDVLDNETADFVVSQSGGSTSVSESGSSDVIQVRLRDQPLTNVILDVTPSVGAAFHTDKSRLLFTPANWNTAQSVTVTGLNDFRINGTRAEHLEFRTASEGSDPAFQMAAVQTLSVFVTDDDVAGLTVIQTGGGTAVRESGTTDTFDIALTAEPESDVAVRIESRQLDEVTVTPDFITFTPVNWNVARTVTVTGVDDSVFDQGAISQVVIAVDGAVSASSFAGVADRIVSVTTIDDDVAELVVTATDHATRIDESGTSDQLQIVLGSKPLSPVVVRIAVQDATEARIDHSEISFTPERWNIAQIVSVIGVDDHLVDGDVLSSVTVSVSSQTADSSYRLLPPQTLSVLTREDDVAGFSVNRTTATVTESGGSDTFSVTLDAIPLSNVVLNVTSLDPGEVRATPSTLTFTPTSWNVAQTVTVVGALDNLTDGDQQTDVRISVNRSGSDGAFSRIPDAVVSVTTTDIDRTTPVVLDPVINGDQPPVLRWTPVPGAVSYEVTVNLTGGTANPVISTSVSSTTFQVAENLPIGRYRTWVRAEKGDGSRSEWSSSVMEISHPVAVSDTLPFHGTTVRPELNWDPVPGATGYRVYMSNLTTGATALVDEIVDATSFTPSADLSFGRYRFFVRAITAGNFQAEWNSGIDYYVGPQLNGPLLPQLNRRPLFSWTAVPGADSYRLYVVGPGGVLIDQSGIRTPQFTPAADLPRGDFRWWILPSTSSGQRGAWSPAAEFSTGGRTRISSPVGAIGNSTPLLSWPAVPDAAAYEIYVSRIGTPGALYRQGGITATTWQSQPLNNGSYKVWVRTTLTDGTGVWGAGVPFQVNETSVVLETLPVSPSGPTFSTTPELRWQSVSGADRYDIVVQGEGVTLTKTSVAGTAWVVSDDLPNGEFAWWVRPRNAAGVPGQWSSPLEFNTTGRTAFISSLGSASGLPVFRWLPVSGASHYVLQVDRISDGTSRVIREDRLTTGSFTVTDRLSAGTYRSWVRAIGADGTTLSPWSFQLDFVVTTADAAGKPDLDAVLAQRMDWLNDLTATASV